MDLNYSRYEARCTTIYNTLPFNCEMDIGKEMDVN